MKYYLGQSTESRTILVLDDYKSSQTKKEQKEKNQIIWSHFEHKQIVQKRHMKYKRINIAPCNKSIMANKLL